MGEKGDTYTVPSKLAVEAHEREREEAPARVGGVDEPGVVPDGLHLADLDHLLELSELQFDQRVRLAIT